MTIFHVLKYPISIQEILSNSSSIDFQEIYNLDNDLYSRWYHDFACGEYSFEESLHILREMLSEYEGPLE